MTLEKTLNDFAEYTKVNDQVQKLKAEEQEVVTRMQEIETELSKPKPTIDGQDAWRDALENNDAHYNIDIRASLREEFALLEGRARFIREALGVGEQELDKLHGRYSREICQAFLPEIEEDARLALIALKQLSDINERERARLARIESEGVRTDSLPRIGYDISGRWNDQYGGRVVSHQRHIAEAFPSLASLAGQAIKQRLRALAEREQAFNEEATK